MAKKYSTALLTIDGVVIEAISNGNTPAGMRARELCAETARKKAEEMKAVETEEDKKLGGGLSMEQVQAHTAGQAAVASNHSNTQSIISNRKTSSMAGAPGKDKHAKMIPPAVQHAGGAAVPDASSNSQV